MTNILFLSATPAPASNLPSLYFSRACCDGAEFQVEGLQFPTLDALHSMLIAEDDEWNLIAYDEVTGRGFLQVIDWTAPEPGTVVSLRDARMAA